MFQYICFTATEIFRKSKPELRWEETEQVSENLQQNIHLYGQLNILL